MGLDWGKPIPWGFSRFGKDENGNYVPGFWQFRIGRYLLVKTHARRLPFFINQTDRARRKRTARLIASRG